MKNAYRSRVREEVLDAYGGKCNCCGESIKQFLTFNHVNNDGSAHRKVVPISNIAWWARKNGYPKMLQVLCQNCNAAKAHYGGCPHQKHEIS